MLWLHTLMLPLNLLWLWGEDVLTCKINTGGLNECGRAGSCDWTDDDDDDEWIFSSATLFDLQSCTDNHNETGKLNTLHLVNLFLKHLTVRSVSAVLKDAAHILCPSSHFDPRELHSHRKKGHSIKECHPPPQQSAHHNLIMKLADGSRSF